MSLVTDILKEVPLSAVLREKISALEAEVTALKDENASLKDDLRQAKAGNHRLKDELSKFAHEPDLDDSHVAILKILSTGRTLLGPEFYSLVPMARVQVDYYLQSLADLGYVHKRKPRIGRPYHYSLSQKGRQYLLEHDLIS